MWFDVLLTLSNIAITMSNKTTFLMLSVNIFYLNDIRLCGSLINIDVKSLAIVFHSQAL